MTADPMCPLAPVTKTRMMQNLPDDLMSASVIRLAQVMSVSVITVRKPAYHEGMVRWEPNARGRLGQAAFELFTERGFEQVTVAEIAERAGLTERTFFRYFADKREVLFAGAEAVPGALRVRASPNAPDSAAPIDAVAAALYAAAAMFLAHEDARPAAAAIIAAHPDLRERELIKLAAVAAAVADALRRRGVAEPAAALDGRGGHGRLQDRLRPLDRRPRRARPRPAHPPSHSTS